MGRVYEALKRAAEAKAANGANGANGKPREEAAPSAPATQAQNGGPPAAEPQRNGHGAETRAALAPDIAPETLFETAPHF